MTRYEPYPPPAVYPTEAPSIRNMGPLVPDHQTVPPHREEYASEQVSRTISLVVFKFMFCTTYRASNNAKCTLMVNYWNQHFV